MHIRSLLILGCGYVGERLGKACIESGIQVFGTTRSKKRAEELMSVGIEPVLAKPESIPSEILNDVQAILDSIPLTRNAYGMHATQPSWLPGLAPKLTSVQWAGYLSTTGVYGDAHGAWVDESWPCKPSSARGSERLKAEAAWLESGLPAEVFRIAGIYGPGRNIIPKLRAGGYTAVRWQTPHYAARIHVDDIVTAIMAAMVKSRPGRIANLADDEPLPHDEYVTELARMVDAPAPVILSPEEGEQQISPAALSFFRDNKRVSNRLLHDELLAQLKYPSFRDAAASLAGDSCHVPAARQTL